MKLFPNNLRKIRTTQDSKELRSGNRIAELMNLSPQYYYDLETGRGGRKLNADHINKLTKIFDVTADEILGDQTLNDSPDETKKPKDLIKFLNQSEVMFDGIVLSESDKEKVRKALELAFWDAKQQNKRKKS